MNKEIENGTQHQTQRLAARLTAMPPGSFDLLHASTSRKIKLRKRILVCLLGLVLLVSGGYYLINRNELNEKEETLELMYTAWACGCPDWSRPAQHEKLGESFDPDALGIYIEPASSEVELPDSYYYSGNKIRFTGRFYQKKGYPKGMTRWDWNSPTQGWIFHYTGYEIVEPFQVWVFPKNEDSESTTVTVKKKKEKRKNGI